MATEPGGQSVQRANARADNLGYPARAIRTTTHLYIWNMKPDRWPAGDPDGYFDIGAPRKFRGAAQDNVLLMGLS